MVTKYRTEEAQIARKHTVRVGAVSPHTGTVIYGLVACRWAFASCGAGTLEAFGGVGHFASWAEKAALMSELYKAQYNCGYTTYAITDSQLNDATHQALLEIGSKELASWPNLYHGPQNIHLFLVNLRDCVDVFCNEYGEPFTEPFVGPKQPKEHKPPADTLQYGTIPKRT